MNPWVDPFAGINRDTIYTWITGKKMPAHKAGGLWEFLASEVEAWIKGVHGGEDPATDPPDTVTKRKSAQAE